VKRALVPIAAWVWLMLPLQAGMGVKTFRAGAHIVDITPRTFPIKLVGELLPRAAVRVAAPLHARALALDDGSHRIVIVVADTLMMPRDLIDRVKEAAAKSTGVPPEKMLISATHSHMVPSVMGALGTVEDRGYMQLFEASLVKAIEGALRNLAPVRVGWAVAEAPEYTNCRRWILRSDRIRRDPFGDLTIRATQHPGYQNPDFIGPSGPIDPQLSMVSFQSPDGRPIALLANYSMHFVGGPDYKDAVSSDYYGFFAETMGRLIGVPEGDHSFVAMMSQGTSGDLMWMDYSQPKRLITPQAYASALAAIAHKAYRSIGYHDWVPLDMCETRLKLSRRVPSPQRLAWAKAVVGRMGNAPRSKEDVYAREQLLLIETGPERELKLQAIRIGDLGITAIPNEVFGITGLKLKAQSPLTPTLNIGLANGAEGYIPPPEQHKLGGYTTWLARTASLEAESEPRILDTLLSLLEKASDRRRLAVTDVNGPYAKTVLAAKPLAYWRCNEFSGPSAFDATGHGNRAVFEDGIAFYLDGPQSPAFSGTQVNRAPHFAGGRMTAALPGLGERYSVEMWFYNGMPADVRPVTGYLFEIGGDQLAIGGTARAAGKLLFERDGEVREGIRPMLLKTWNYLVFVRDKARVSVYLNGAPAPEIEGEVWPRRHTSEFIIGGHHDHQGSFEGKIDEVAVFNRVLRREEISVHYQLATEAPPR
jgi:hypothetical protein